MSRSRWLPWSAALALWASSSWALAADKVTEAPVAPESAVASTADEVSAAAEPQSEPGDDVVVFDRVSVVGSTAESYAIPGSAHYLGQTLLEEQAHDDIHRVLRQVPGVNIQEEEGYGLRPNIGMRGTGVERSQKITLLEDGVLIAPAPYAAPAAYYFPTTGRMDGIEVRKGSASIIQGPYTNGGVINLLSSDVPSQWALELEAAAGEHGTRRFEGLVGNSGERVGWLLQTYQLETDGFKVIDGGGDAGVDLEDYLGKLRFTSRADARIYQALEIKLGATNQLGHETYLGLTEADFSLDPYRRYIGSANDLIRTDHDQQQLRWFAQLAPNLDVTATVYNNDYYRNWYKLEKVAGVSAREVLAAPAAFSRELAVVRGEVDTQGGPLTLRNNRRSYYSRGAEAIVGWALEGERVQHSLSFGVRFHRDQEDRFQEEDGYDIVDGRMELASRGAPGSHANRIADADALAIYVQDEIRAGRWTLVPGVRLETIDFLRTDYGRADPGRTGASLAVRENEVDVVIPGLGATFALTDRWSLLGGVHKGFSPPGPGRNADTEAEESVNYEVGVRFAAGETRASAVAFFNDYENLLGTDTVSSGGGGTGDQFNGGAVEVAGLELELATDWGRRAGWRLGVPMRLAYTYTTAEFQTSFTTSFADWSPEVRAGDRVPYIPESQWALMLGLTGPRWSLHTNLGFTDEMRTRAGQGPIPAGEGTDDSLVLDLSAEVDLLERLRLFGQVRNLTGEAYVVARRPAGLRPGLARTALLGLSWEMR